MREFEANTRLWGTKVETAVEVVISETEYLYHDDMAGLCGFINSIQWRPLTQKNPEAMQEYIEEYIISNKKQGTPSLLERLPLSFKAAMELVEEESDPSGTSLEELNEFRVDLGTALEGVTKDEISTVVQAFIDTNYVVTGAMVSLSVGIRYSEQVLTCHGPAKLIQK